MIAAFDELMDLGQSVAEETFGSRRDSVAGADSILNWNESDYHGTFGPNPEASAMLEAGYRVTYDGSWIGNKSQFNGSFPELRNVVTVGGVRYRIVERTIDNAVELRLVKP